MACPNCGRNEVTTNANLKGWFLDLIAEWTDIRFCPYCGYDLFIRFVRCDSIHDFGAEGKSGSRCQLSKGHKGPHRCISSHYIEEWG